MHLNKLGATVISNIKLEYNLNSCTKLISPLKTKYNLTYWYSDFEADVLGSIHRLFMCVLQSQNGKINKEFRGEELHQEHLFLAVQLLEYLPDGAVIYYHNFSYDISI